MEFELWEVIGLKEIVICNVRDDPAGRFKKVRLLILDQFVEKINILHGISSFGFAGKTAS